MADLEQEASNPQTRPARLQELANNYPRLRPLIAMNPATYPALVEWLGTLGDPAVNVALAQRDALNRSGGGGPRRISVMGREYAQDAKTPTVGGTGAEGPGGSTVGESDVGSGNPLPSAADSPVGAATAQATATNGTSPSRASTVPVAALILVLVAIIVVAFVGYRLLTSSPSSSSTETQSTVVTTDEGGGAESSTNTSDADASPEATEAAPREPLFPAPSSALPLSVFVSPSGNIACSLGEETVTCTINSYNFVSEEMQTCGAGPLSITATAEKAGVDCAANAVQAAGATTLAYEDFATNGNTACRSTEDGVACWNTITGVGFGISRSGYQIGLTEPIDPREFPWA